VSKFNLYEDASYRPFIVMYILISCLNMAIKFKMHQTGDLIYYWGFVVV